MVAAVVRIEVLGGVPVLSQAALEAFWPGDARQQDGSGGASRERSSRSHTRAPQISATMR